MGPYFMWSCHMVFYNGCTHLNSFTPSASIPFFWVFSSICYLLCFDDSHSNWSKVLSHCIWSAFFCWLMVLIIFNTPFAYVYAFFSYRLFAHLTCLAYWVEIFQTCRVPSPLLYSYLLETLNCFYLHLPCDIFFSSHIWKSDSHNIQLHNASVIRLCNEYSLYSGILE